MSEHHTPIPHESTLEYNYLERLEYLRRKVLIDNGPGRPAVIKLASPAELSDFLPEAEYILQAISSELSQPSNAALADQHTRRLRAHLQLALDIAEAIRLELTEYRTITVNNLGRTAAGELVV